MVLARHPQGFISQHAMIASKNIFDSRGDGMPQVQRSRNIGWRHSDDKRLASRSRARLEVAALLPEMIPLAFNSLWLVSFRQRLPPEHRIGPTIIPLDP